MKYDILNALILRHGTFFKIALFGHIFMINEPREIKICKHKLEAECSLTVAF